MTAKIWDVIVVGAGLSGLSAAHLLRTRNAKLRVLVLEAKDRVGGRTVSTEIPAANGVDRWDFGGQWVGSTQTHIMELVKELGLDTFPQYNIGKKVHHMGGPGARVRTYRNSIPALSPLVLMDLTQFLWKIDRLCATVRVEDPSKTPNAVELDSVTLHSYTEKHVWTAELKEELALCSRSVFGMEPSQMSFLFFLMYAAAAGGLLPLLENTAGSAQEFKIKGGTQQLSECLAERVGLRNVRLRAAVTAIWQDAEWARVTIAAAGAAATFLCRAAIVTCPPHLAAKIHYDPALPSRREFLTQNMPVGHMIKFIITYQTAGQRRNAVVSSLVKYLGPEAASFIHFEERDWAAEAYSGGCPVNVMAPGLLTYYHPSLRKPCGRIYWAGTETATQWCGYMSGAVQAGERAALEVLAELRPTGLEPEE
ncbi:amine oxidase [flavin-containing] isoform X2 [Scophthalmus maximus]|uniref:amine oxidase [flavin-containing] isoform X2 n=1 Tax=Scophthalmus maximus TaxID=52904 RepID=UPI001FA93FCE|nr:amine oxidase [flavin-containing] isoform X2 [Scophthalmus maximus]